MNTAMNTAQMNRREFLKQLGCAASMAAVGSAGILLPEEAAAVNNMHDFWTRDRFIDCRRADTGERGKLLFYRGNQGGYQKDVYRHACWFLRDAKDNNAVISMDIGLLNLLYALQEWARISGISNPLITINSAYRTARRNATIEGAARNSLHIQGKAVDLTMRGVDLDQLQQMAKHYRVGGVGIYRNFIHLDTGRVRYWHGK